MNTNIEEKSEKTSSSLSVASLFLLLWVLEFSLLLAPLFDQFREWEAVALPEAIDALEAVENNCDC